MGRESPASLPSPFLSSGKKRKEEAVHRHVLVGAVDRRRASSDLPVGSSRLLAAAYGWPLPSSLP